MTNGLSDLTINPMQETGHLLSAHAMATAFPEQKQGVTSPHTVGGLSPQMLCNLHLSTHVTRHEPSAEVLLGPVQ